MREDLTTIDALLSSIQQSYDAVEAIQRALELPFRPIPLQPIADLREQLLKVRGEMKAMSDGLALQREQIKALQA